MTERMTFDELIAELDKLHVLYARNEMESESDGWIAYGITKAKGLIEANRSALEAGLVSERIKELNLIIKTMEENIQALEADDEDRD